MDEVKTFCIEKTEDLREFLLHIQELSFFDISFRVLSYRNVKIVETFVYNRENIMIDRSNDDVV